VTRSSNYAVRTSSASGSGTSFFLIAMTEPGAGSDPSMIRGSPGKMAATDEVILMPRRSYCSAFGLRDGAVVPWSGEPEEKGVRPFMAFVVEKGAQGLTDSSSQEDGYPKLEYCRLLSKDCPAVDQQSSTWIFKKTMIVLHNGTRRQCLPGLIHRGIALGLQAVRSYGSAIRPLTM